MKVRGKLSHGPSMASNVVDCLNKYDLAVSQIHIVNISDTVSIPSVTSEAATVIDELTAGGGVGVGVGEGEGELSSTSTSMPTTTKIATIASTATSNYKHTDIDETRVNRAYEVGAVCTLWHTMAHYTPPKHTVRSFLATLPPYLHSHPIIMLSTLPCNIGRRTYGWTGR